MNAGTITGEEAARRLGEDKKDYEGELDIIRQELGSRPLGNIKYTDPDYRDPSMFIGYESPDEYDNNITSFKWEHTDPHPDMEDHARITTSSGPGWAVQTQEIQRPLGLEPANPLGLSEEEKEEYKADYFTQADSTNTYYEIDGVRVYVQYGSHTLGHDPVDPAVEMETIKNSASISMQRIEGSKATFNTFRTIGKFLDRIKEENPGIRLFADAKGDPVDVEDADDDTEEMFEKRLDEAMARSRGDLRARVYTRFGWEKLYEAEGTDAGGWHMEYKPDSPRPPMTPTAFDGIDSYANDIMELV